MINEILPDLYQFVIGNQIFAALGVLLLIVGMLLIFRAGKIVIAMLAFPLVTTFMVSTQFIELPKYASVLMWLAGGVIFAGVLIALIWK